MVVERSFEYVNRAYFIFDDKGLPIVKRPFLLLSTMKESIAQPSFGSWCNWLPLIWRIPCFYIEQTTWQTSYWTILLGEPSGGPLQVTLFRPYANHLPICFVSIKTMVYMTILVSLIYLFYISHASRIQLKYTTASTPNNNQSMNFFQKWIQIPKTISSSKKVQSANDAVLLSNLSGGKRRGNLD